MAEIYLSKGKYTLLDDEDVEKVLAVAKSWHFDRYAKTNTWDSKARKVHCVYMHRVIMNAINGTDVDHINGDKLDNRKVNLRLCSRSENVHNKNYQKVSSTGFHGVYKYAREKTYWSKINVNGKGIKLGRFKTAEEAAEAYKAAVRLYYPGSVNYTL